MIHFNLFNQFENLSSPNLSLLYYKYTPDFQEQEAIYKYNKWKGSPKDDFKKKISAIHINPDSLEKRIAILREKSDSSYSIQNYTRFVCGMGYDSTLENGFSFDWTTGFPYLPGSSLKGALLGHLSSLLGKKIQKMSTDVITLLDRQDVIFNKADIDDIFGTQNPNVRQEEKTQGHFVFHNVYPVRFEGFETEVMTPHYGGYYSASKKPDDTESPNPIKYLTVKRGSTFKIFIKKINRLPKERMDSLSDKLGALIREVVTISGLGAKTSSGYGFFKWIVEE